MLVDVVSTHDSCKSYREKAVKNADLRLTKTLSSLTLSASVPDPLYPGAYQVSGLGKPANAKILLTPLAIATCTAALNSNLKR